MEINRMPIGLIFMHLFQRGTISIYEYTRIKKLSEKKQMDEFIKLVK